MPDRFAWKLMNSSCLLCLCVWCYLSRFGDCETVQDASECAYANLEVRALTGLYISWSEAMSGATAPLGSTCIIRQLRTSASCDVAPRSPGGPNAGIRVDVGQRRTVRRCSSGFRSLPKKRSDAIAHPTARAAPSFRRPVAQVRYGFNPCQARGRVMRADLLASRVHLPPVTRITTADPATRPRRHA